VWRVVIAFGDKGFGCSYRLIDVGQQSDELTALVPRGKRCHIDDFTLTLGRFEGLRS
jgi:hypothetical protein